MTKRLLVMRHAKSAWNQVGLTDFQRPLNERGCRDAPRMGQWLIERGLEPDCVISSTAQRARQTADLVTEQFPMFSRERLIFKDDLYHAPARVYGEQLETLSDPQHHTLLLIGHNPGLEDFVDLLSGEYHRMSTAAIAFFEVEQTPSATTRQAAATLINLWRPKEVLY